MVDVNDIVGHDGNFNRRIIVICCYKFFITAVWHYLFNFITLTPDFACFTDALESSMDNSNVTNVTAPLTCYMSSINSSSSTERCSIFSYSTPKRFSIVTEFDLVCSRKWFISIGYWVFSFANFISFIPTGIMADKFGRRPVIIVGLVVAMFSCIMVFFAQSLLFIYSMFFLIGTSYVLIYSPGHCYYMECLSAERRAVNNLMYISWGTGLLFLTGMSYLIPDWRYLVLITTVPCQLLHFIIVCRFFPESTRWLLTKKHYKKAKKNIDLVLKINNNEVYDVDIVMKQLTAKIEEDRKGNVKATFCTILKISSLRKAAISISVIGFCQAFVNRGFSIVITQFGGSFHLNMCMFGLIRIVYAFVGALIVKYVRRKRTILICCLVETIGFFASAICSIAHYQWLEIIVSLVAMTCNIAIGNILNIYTSEVFPTRARVTMQGFIKTISRIGQMISPFADLLGRIYGRYVVNIIFGMLLLIALLVSFLLPETKDCELPDTLGESKEIATRKYKSRLKVGPGGDKLLSSVQISSANADELDEDVPVADGVETVDNADVKYIT